ncbi:MAG TPA: MFS transporter, partial [Nannocystis exedens]|nr:MFS transporter [Nannocystis exedens]
MPAKASESADPRTPAPAVWTGTTYFAEGLPWSILHQVAAEFFTAMGLPARQVGYTSALHLTSTLKFIWSPLVDLFGSLRQWMIATQAALGIAVGVIALLANQLSAGGDTTLVWVVLVIIGVLSATHDIACDGYYMDALSRDLQARYSGIRVAAFRVAMLVGSSALVYLGGRVSWLLAFGAAALILGGLALFHRIFLPLGKGEGRRAAADSRQPTTTHQTAAEPTPEEAVGHVLDAYLSFLTQRRAL